MVEEFPAGDGESAGDGEFPAGDGKSSGDGESTAGNGLAPDGDGLPAGAQILSATVEPALLSTSVVALHVVQFVQDNWFDAVENFPDRHASHARLVLMVPLADIR